MSSPQARSWLFVVLLLALWVSTGAAADGVKNRSTSRTGQFVVYCDDRDLRMKVASYAEDLKDEMLRLFRDNDGWSPRNHAPIVVNIFPPGDTPPATPVTVRWMNTPGGSRIDLVVRLGGDPSNVFLQRHLLQAILLERSFRNRPAPGRNEPYLMPPWWLIEGIIASLRQREGGEDRDIFKSIVDTQKLPALDKWLSQPPVHLDTSAGAIDRACAMCLLEAILALPGGPDGLHDFIAAWPASGGDAVSALSAEFPGIAGTEQSLAKWWALQLARYARGDQLQGMSIADTDQALSGLLSFEIAVDKAGKTEKFELKDFSRFAKLPAAKNALRGMQIKLVTLCTKAHPTMRPVLEEYALICSQLCTGKTRKIADRIHDNEQFRESIVRRLAQITDYLNWFEATQPAARTGSFADYLKQADKLMAPIPVDPRITEYLNTFEPDFAPFQPGEFPELKGPPEIKSDIKSDITVNR